MQRRHLITAAVVALGLGALTAGGSAQAPPAARPAAQAAPAPPQIAVVPMMFREEWRVPAATVEGRRRIVLPESVVSMNLELKIYGQHPERVEVIRHQGNHDYGAKSQLGGQHLWNGNTPSPVALMLRDKNNFADLTGLARVRAVIRTDGLHVLYPALKLADGTLIAGHRGISTEGFFVTTETHFNGMRWYRVDPKTVTSNTSVPNPDLSRIDEVGFVDLMPGGGNGLPGGWFNLSVVELYAKPVPRTAPTTN